MGNKIERLIEILEGEAEIYEELALVSASEREAMSSYSLEDMELCHKSRKSLNLKIGQFEAARGSLVRDMSADMELPAELLTISRIIETAIPGEAVKLDSCRKRIREVSGKIRASEEANRAIAGKSMAFIGESIKVLSGFNPNGSVYTSAGYIEKKSGPGCRLRREV